MRSPATQAAPDHSLAGARSFTSVDVRTTHLTHHQLGCGPSSTKETPMTRTRRMLAGAAVALTLAAGAVTHPVGASGEDVTLSYFTFSAAPDHLADLDAIVAAFEADHPNITIEVQTAAYADYFTSLQTQIAGGSAP